MFHDIRVILFLLILEDPISRRDSTSFFELFCQFEFYSFFPSRVFFYFAWGLESFCWKFYLGSHKKSWILRFFVFFLVFFRDLPRNCCKSWYLGILKIVKSRERLEVIIFLKIVKRCKKIFSR